jgi:SAM-dependent methyltransferase
LLKSIPIRSNRFGFEPEITMKCAKRKLRIYEVPISYHGRTYEEGKKIGWKDGLKALGAILHFWLIDDLYSEPYGRAFLNNLAGTPQYLSWMVRELRPHLRDTVFELGAGIGNMSGRLMAKRIRYVSAERDPLYLHSLRNRFLRTPNVEVARLDPNEPAAFEPFAKSFGTALCLNVLEYSDDPRQLLRSLFSVLEPGGNLVVLVPQSPTLFGRLDQRLGHKRRFTRAELAALLETEGFQTEQLKDLNRIATPAWWLYGKVFGKGYFTKIVLKLFDKSVWLWRRVDGALPWHGLSLIAVARKPAGAAAPRPEAPVEANAIGRV